MGQALFLFTCTCLRIAHRGWIQKFQKKVAGTLASYLDSFDFSENSIKIIQNFKEKGVALVTVFRKPETD